ERKNPVRIAKEAVQQAVKNINDVVILDTAGRLHIDETMMSELREIVATVKPDEILMVVDAMTGQDAVNSAKAFNEALELSGFVVTKLDGDARGGVILSIRHVTGRPVKFIGISEKPDGIETFYPDRVTGRILGMGDVLSLIDKLQSNIDEEKAKEMEEKFLKNKFDLEDFLNQLKEVKKLGSIADIMEMIPGAPKDVDLAGSEKSMKRTEAIISSMTSKERRNPKLLNYSRKQRVARGSGTTIQDVNKLLKSYDQMRSMMKQFGKKGKLFKSMKGFPF
ncbi:MAG: Signal recognition particle protein, partial [Mesotoga prima]